MFHVKHINDNEILELLYKLAIKSAKNGDFPVSAIIIFNENIIGKGYNNRHKCKNILGHAEVNAILDAQKYIKDWRLNNCILVTTLKPCNMCAEIINASRISKVYYILDQDTTKYNYEYEQIFDFNNIFVNKYKRLFEETFKNIR